LEGVLPEGKTHSDVITCMWFRLRCLSVRCALLDGTVDVVGMEIWRLLFFVDVPLSFEPFVGSDEVPFVKGGKRERSERCSAI
jgi:hypothetical protein